MFRQVIKFYALGFLGLMNGDLKRLLKRFHGFK